MSSHRKQFCVHLGCGKAVTKVGRSRYEYCEEHTCKAFSVSYGKCRLGLEHKEKHASIMGEEWG